MRVYSRATLAERLARHIAIGDGCWEWRAQLGAGGYGQITENTPSDGRKRTTLRAHRAVYELLVGPITDGLTLDHLCRNRRCVRPDHMEPVTVVENLARGDSWKHQQRKTQCPHGHAYSVENTWHRKEGGRQCRTCHRERERVRAGRARGASAA